MPDIVFQVGQEVVYPLQGVGRIQKMESRQFRGKTVSYFIIYLDGADMTIMAPVDKVEDLGIRPIVSKEESEIALKTISGDPNAVPADWKLRYQMNLDLLKKGSIHDIAAVVCQLYHRSKVKELPIMERKLFESAMKLLVDELAYSLRMEKGEIEKMIFLRLES
jgi:CarD family transcriptional regulator